ncbi:hypothetical protein ANCCAN_27557 [Ancylostoma caninum]|uniref:Uncharacterized protein n=1 Tax=Ancylostoma caninum TaxID=29170 RepID=A0A368F3P4_ANCCA|nr:hypothetical protein ANCCAN_27557 [Ancylostoma caninum]
MCRRHLRQAAQGPTTRLQPSLWSPTTPVDVDRHLLRVRRRAGHVAVHHPDVHRHLC